MVRIFMFFILFFFFLLFRIFLSSFSFSIHIFLFFHQNIFFSCTEIHSFCSISFQYHHIDLVKYKKKIIWLALSLCFILLQTHHLKTNSIEFCVLFTKWFVTNHSRIPTRPSVYNFLWIFLHKHLFFFWAAINDWFIAWFLIKSSIWLHISEEMSFLQTFLVNVKTNYQSLSSIFFGVGTSPIINLILNSCFLQWNI